MYKAQRFKTLANCVRYGLLGLAIALTLLFSAIPGIRLPDHQLITGYNDIVFHIGAFGAIALLVLIGNRAKVFWISVLLMSAVAIELFQFFLPRRTPSAEDILFGWLGTFMASWFANAIENIEMRGNIDHGT